MFDAIVVGARCAGSPTAMLLARDGHRVLLVDRATFPSDTISTHWIWQLGLACLKRWGLLDRVLATNCPLISKMGMNLGAFQLIGDLLPGDGVAATCVPRRTVLDKILVDAAREAGAEVRKLLGDRAHLVQWPGHGHPRSRPQRHRNRRTSTHRNRCGWPKFAGRQGGRGCRI